MPRLASVRGAWERGAKSLRKSCQSLDGVAKLQLLRHRQLISLNTHVEGHSMMVAHAREVLVLSNIKSVLIATTPDRRVSSALSYGLSLAQVSEAHVAVEILAPKIVLGHMHLG